MTPYEIRILLMINSSPNWRDNIDVDMHSDLWYETIQKFKEIGFLSLDLDDQGTQRLKIYCEALCNMPLPVQQWVMP